MATKKEKMSFEDAMQQLEIIVSQLERADIPLEEALTQFQKGVALSQFCKTTLDNAEQTVMTVLYENGMTKEVTSVN